ncbi:MAG TPA: tetratricopeptide repeat protein [Gammaproteobacteria bacterium]|jgi:tetratricopeptide (TPR) repeat protein
MTIHAFRRLFFSIVLIISGTGLAASDSQLQHAQSLLDSGRLAEAEVAYQNVLLDEPRSIEANLGLATINAWKGDYRLAIFRYGNVLEQQPDHFQALVGLGYAQGWSGQFDKAQATFARAARLAPENFDVEKGAAFIALWRADAAAAVAGFERLVADHPDDVELRVALGQAYLLDTNSQGAIESFNAALLREPDNNAARSGYLAAHSMPSKLEVDILWGNNDGDTGLRQVEIGSWVNTRSRIWLRYDDSLSLDVPDLTSGDAETLLIGVFHQFDDGWLGKFEFGQRDLPDGEGQDIYSFEVTRLLQRKNYKLGLQSAPHSNDYTDTLLYTSFGFASGEHWFIEPTLYLSETGQLEDQSRRLLTRFAYQSDSLWGIDFGIGFGETRSDLDEFDGSIRTNSIDWYMPISPSVRISILFSNEETPASDTTSAILGVTWRMQKGEK